MKPVLAGREVAGSGVQGARADGTVRVLDGVQRRHRQRHQRQMTCHGSARAYRNLARLGERSRFELPFMAYHFPHVKLPLVDLFSTIVLSTTKTDTDLQIRLSKTNTSWYSEFKSFLGALMAHFLFSFIWRPNDSKFGYNVQLRSCFKSASSDL